MNLTGQLNQKVTNRNWSINPRNDKPNYQLPMIYIKNHKKYYNFIYSNKLEILKIKFCW